MKRRDFLLKTAPALLPMIAMPYLNFGRHRVFASSDATYSTHAIDLVREYVVVDMLNQVSYRPEELPVWLKNPEKFTAVDAKKLAETGTDVYAIGHGARSRALGINYFIDWNKFLAFHSQWLKRIDTPEDMRKVNSNGKSGILLTLQDSNHFESLDDVDLFYSLGQRLSLLTYNYQNRLGSGAFVDKDLGLTDYGRQVVARMNTVGMMVDVAHCGDRVTLEAIDISTKPVMITHANCRALVPGHPRAKTDEMIRNMAAKGGVMGIAEIRFMVRDSEPVTVEHFLDHYDYMLKLVGAEYVGIGTDFDLDSDDRRFNLEERKKIINDTSHRAKKYRMHSNEEYLVGIEGLNHPKRVYDIVEGFIRRGYSDSTIKLILGENFIRVAKAVWK